MPSPQISHASLCRLAQTAGDSFRCANLTQLISRSQLLQELQSRFTAGDLVFFGTNSDSIGILQAVVLGGFLYE